MNETKTLSRADAAINAPRHILTQRQLCDLELLTCGAFAPLRGFLTQQDYESVCEDMRLADGTLWPIPITLRVDRFLVERAQVNGRLSLCDPDGTPLAVLHVESVFDADPKHEAEAVFGTTDPAHAGVAMLFEEAGTGSATACVGGLVEEIADRTRRQRFGGLLKTPAETKALFAERGLDRILAFQTRNPLHRAHVEMIRRGAETNNASILLHPVVGATRPGDVDAATRVRCYRAVLPRLAESAHAELAVLPLAMRMAGPREALWHALIRRNYGCTHFLVGRDHAGPGAGPDGKPFYGPYAAQELVAMHEAEASIQMVAMPELRYAPDQARYCTADELPADAPTVSMSGTELRRELSTGKPLPEWFTFPEVERELRQSQGSGICIFFTGLSGSGKSTIARILADELTDEAHQVTVLDGDLVRRFLSSELTFSKEHRDLNIRRVGFVAAEVIKHGGTAICAAIAPYDKIRREVRKLVERHGRFLLVHVATPLAVCEERDTKGLYRSAREGLISGFTGISDPYEPPTDPDIVIDTSEEDAASAARRILALASLPERPPTSAMT